MTTAASWYAKSEMLPAWCERVGFAILKAERWPRALPGSSAVGLCCHAPVKHSFLTELFGMELPKTDPQNSEAGWIGLQWGSPSSRHLSVLEAAVTDLGAA